MSSRFEKSLPYNSNKGCPDGYHHRKGYTSKTGKYVEPRCVRSTTVHKESQEEFRANVTAKQRGRLRGVHERLGFSKKCKKGYILRAPYKRKYSSSLKKQGYNVHRGNKTYRAYPVAGSTLVKASCVKDRGLPGLGADGNAIGPLRKGELSQYGYNAHLSSEKRHEALKKAIESYGALGVFRKLDAVAKLTKRTAPEASKVFTADRDWIRKHFVLKAPFE